MLPLSQLLERFKGLKNTEKIKKELVADIFLKNNIPINTKQILFVNKTIQIKTQPIIKTEIFLKKNSLLTQINKELKESGFLNIQ